MFSRFRAHALDQLRLLFVDARQLVSDLPWLAF